MIFNFISEVAFLSTDQSKRDGQAQELKVIDAKCPPYNFHTP